MISEKHKKEINDMKEKLSQLSGMTSLAERMYLYQYARNEYLGEGEIVDLGCWLGSSTISLAMGLENNPRVNIKENRIHAYDLFQWKPYMAKHPSVVGTSMENQYKKGDSFVDEYIKRVEPWASLIEVNQSDLTKTHWNHDNNIDYLFVDAMKSWSLAQNIIEGFFSGLVPGKSLIHYNDWVNTLQYEIHLLMYRMRDKFEPIEQAANAMIFKPIDPIENDTLNDSYSLEYFSSEEIDSAFEYVLSISPVMEGHPSLAAAKVKCLIDLGDLEKARQEFNLAKVKKEELSSVKFNFDRMFARLEELLSQA